MSHEVVPPQSHTISLNGELKLKRPGGKFRCTKMTQAEADALLAEIEQCECPDEIRETLAPVLEGLPENGNFVVDRVLNAYFRGAQGNSWTAGTPLQRLVSGGVTSSDASEFLRSNANIRYSNSETLPARTATNLPATVSNTSTRTQLFREAEWWEDTENSQWYVRVEVVVLHGTDTAPSTPFTVRQLGVYRDNGGNNLSAAALLDTPVVLEANELLLTSYVAYFPTLTGPTGGQVLVATGQIQTKHIDLDEVETDGPLIDWEMHYYPGPRNADPDSNVINIMAEGSVADVNWSSADIRAARVLANTTSLNRASIPGQPTASASVEAGYPDAQTQVMQMQYALSASATVVSDTSIRGFAFIGSHTLTTLELLPTQSTAQYPIRIFFPGDPLIKKWNESLSIEATFTISFD